LVSGRKGGNGDRKKEKWEPFAQLTVNKLPRSERSYLQNQVLHEFKKSQGKVAELSSISPIFVRRFRAPARIA
jgi:hypothetical protein